MISQIVARCHVSDSNRTVIKYVISRLRKGYQTWRALSVDQRKAYLRAIVREHQENRELFGYVMKGGR